MDRRKSLKIIGLGTVSGGLLLDACKNPDVKTAAKGEEKKEAAALNYDRTAEEKEIHQALVSKTFFTPHEMATIAVLCDIIIPADDVSGSATQAGVPDFIEFMAKDKPDFQTPLRGGLRWLDMQMIKLHGTPFKDSKPDQQIALVDAIAYPAKAKPEMKQGVSFFSLMRNLTASGFFSSKMGIEDIGYKGNNPNQWNGVPDEVLKQYNLAYTDKELKECVKFA
jgi:gluconate 2-dehydrogenase gamma chain